MRFFVFGYGSLMNPQSLQRTLPGKEIHSRATVLGYQRKMNLPYKQHVFMNIVENPDMRVTGVLVEVSDEELARLKDREQGYDCTDITEAMEGLFDAPVFAFIAPDKEFPALHVKRSYLERCLVGVPEDERTQWLAETIINNPLDEDISYPTKNPT